MNPPSTMGAAIDELEVMINGLIADNATLRAALQTHAEEAAKLIAQRDELLDRLTKLERVAGLGLNYDDPARELARAAITNATKGEA